MSESQNGVAEQNSAMESVTKDKDESPTKADKKPATPEEVSKRTFRTKVWQHLHQNRLCNFPFRTFFNIPNFKGADAASQRLLELEEFRNSGAVWVNPNKALEHSRIHVLDGDKELYVNVPGLKEALLKKLSKVEDTETRRVVSRWGIENTGTAIDIDSDVKIDLLVVGSVAVSKQGRRIGKGRGYADLEFAILKDMGAVNDDTVIVTTVHDCQVMEDLPEHLFGKHDIPVDYILTPTETIKVEKSLARPEGLFWNLLSARRVAEIPVLQKLKQQHEEKGVDTTLKEEDSETETTRAPRPRFGYRRYFRRPRRTRSIDSDEAVDQSKSAEDNGKKEPTRRPRRRFYGRSMAKKKENKAAVTNGEEKSASDTDTGPANRPPFRFYRRKRNAIDFSLHVSNIEKTVRVRDLKNALEENGIKPDLITWRGYKGFCYLHYAKPATKKKQKKEEEKKEVEDNGEKKKEEEEPEGTDEPKPYAVDSVIEVLQKMKISPESNCSLEVKILEPITRIETTDVTAV